MGFFSKIFASANATGHHTAVDDAEAVRQAQIKKIEALLDSVNSASQHVRNYYITFLLACFYIAMIVWSTTDLMLLKDTPVTMPLLNVNLPITGFYTFAPYFFLLLHFNLLLQFSLLADKVHRFDQAVIELHDSDSRRYYYTRLFAFVFTQILSARHHSGLLRFLLTLMVWITAIWLPLGILIGLQVGFLAYHSEEVLFWQRIAVMLDLLVLFIFWPMIRAEDSGWCRWMRQATDLPGLMQKIQPVLGQLQKKTIHQYSSASQPENQTNRVSGYPTLEGSVSVITSLFVIAFVWGIAVLPDSAHEQWVAQRIPDSWKTECKLNPANENGQRYFRLTEFLFDGIRSIRKPISLEDGEDIECEITTTSNIINRNLIIREQLLIDNELKAEDESDLTNEDEAIHQTALKKVTGLILSGRDLRYADFSGARLPKVDFVGAHGRSSDLRYANFSDAMLINARMKGTKLQGINLSSTQLQRADLAEAQLQRAELSNAQLQGANLLLAQLQEAVLYRAKLQGALLSGANLQGASLREAELQGADLASAELQGVGLEDAKLQGAILARAELQGANLSEAQLQGANLSRARLQGAYLERANLQGANLRGVNFQSARLETADFSYSDITRTKFGLLTDQELDDLQKIMTKEIKSNKLLESIASAIIENTEELELLFTESGQVTGDEDSARLYAPMNAFVANKDNSDNLNKLATYLIDLSCQDPWVASGIAENRISGNGSLFSLIFFTGSKDRDIPPSIASSFSKCLLSLRDKKNRAEQSICPAMSKISKYTTLLLEKTATRDDPDSDIQPTFKCETKLSDQDQLSE